MKISLLFLPDVLKWESSERIAMKKKLEKIKSNAYHYGVQLVAVGALTGLFAGAVVTIYNVLTTKAESFSRGVYELLRENPASVRNAVSGRGRRGRHREIHSHDPRQRHSADGGRCTWPDPLPLV